MGNRKIQVPLEHTWRFYSIDVENGQRTYQVHRVGVGINFKANRRAMKELTPQAYMLYMSMVMDAVEREWLLDEEEVTASTSLARTDVQEAIQELIAKKYMTPGEIRIGGVSHKRNTFHLWEETVCEWKA